MNATEQPVVPTGDEELVAQLRAVVEAVPVPDGFDSLELAGTAVRRVRVRRTALAVTGGVAAMGLIVGGVAIGLPQTAPDPVVVAPGLDVQAPREVPPPPAAPPVRYLPVAGGELPALEGVENGVVEPSHSEYRMEGGLVYTLPPGGWSLRGETNVAGHPSEVVWDVSTLTEYPEGAMYSEAEFRPDPMAGSGATVQLAVAPDAASWQVPAPDSGARTFELAGADFVTVVKGEPVTDGLAHWVTNIRSGETGWTVTLDFTDDAVGYDLVRAFLGNLWFEDLGEPEWFEPTYSFPDLGPITPAVPAGWQTAETGGLTYAVPPGWTVHDVEGNFGPGVEWVGPFSTTFGPIEDGSMTDVHWNMFVELGGAGRSQFTYEEPVAGFWNPQRLDVPGADFAQVMPTTGPYWAAGKVRALSADVSLHEAGGGQNVILVITLPDDADGMATLKGILGSLSF